MTLAPWNAPGLDGKKTAWDSLRLAAYDLPGLWTVQGKIGQKIDVQPVKGQKGAKTSNDGPEAATLTIVGELSYEEAAALEVYVDRIHPRKSDQMSGPMTIEHPSASFLGITQVRIRSISLPQIRDDVMVISIEAVEYFEQPKPAKQKQSKPAKPPEESSTPQVTAYYPPSDPWAPSGIDVLDQQWPPSEDNVNGNNPWPPSPQVTNGMNPWSPA